MAGFKKVAPMNPSPDPFYLDIYGWDSAYNLTNDGDTPEYSEYQDIHISSSYEYVLEISSDAYRFAGVMSTFFLRTFDFKFNVSEICDIRDEHGELFSGGYYVSGEGNGEQYFSHAITTATITGYLDQQSAWIETGGYFGASNRGTSLIGWLDIAFHGSIDDERSDKLVLGGNKLEWNDTLGYERDSIGAVTSEGNALFIKALEMLLAAAVTAVMLA